MVHRITKETIQKIGIIGAGQIGPDIALHFSKSLSQNKVNIILIDISQDAIDKAKVKIESKIKKGFDTGVFSQDQCALMEKSLFYSTDYQLLSDADMVLEAATEDIKIKSDIFKKLESITSENCIYLSNSSHLQPELIFNEIALKKRSLVAHYFFPAELNPVVELVASKYTSSRLVDSLMQFYESIGKIPVKVRSRYGYAIDPIFEGLCQVAIQCLEKGMGNEKQIDSAAVKALGLGIGPFTALNLTGGNPITFHGLDEMGKHISPWFQTPETLKVMTRERKTWNTAVRGEMIELDPSLEDSLIYIFRGAYFALVSSIIDSNIIDQDDLNIACEMALVAKAPLAYMNEIGIRESYRMVEEFCLAQKDFPVPESIQRATEIGGWILNDLLTDIRDDVMVVTIRRPKVLNALNLEVLRQIKTTLEVVRANDYIKAIVLTGFGNKAFVSGADLKMLSSLHTPEDAIQNSQQFQSVLNHIEEFPKPIVCALNGVAFGGGNELAMACTARISRSGMPVLVAQPEVNLGFIPGAGGTQRLPRLVGIKKAAEILRTGRSVSSREAREIGLIDQEVEGNLLEAAVKLARNIAEGKSRPHHAITQPIETTFSPEDINLGHLSKKIDSILVKAIYEGSKLNLKEGLTLESQMFGECMNTKDMKIGIANFRQNGPRVKANFIHN